MEEGGQVKTLKAAKKILKIIKKAHGKDNTKEEPSGTKVKELATNPTKNKMCCLIGHNHLRKDCSNNPNSKKYTGSH